MTSQLQNIVQWNLNGFRSKITQLACLITKHQPEILALQETKLPPGEPYQHSTYFLLRKDRNADGGGVALMIYKNISYIPITLNTPLEAVAATFHYQNQKITICSLYIPPVPPAQFPVNHLKTLINSLPKPFLILGDVNSKHTYWGSPTSDNKGKKLADIIDTNTLHVLNNGNPTYHIPSTNYFSHLDTAICSPEIQSKFNWDTESDLYDSDHFPIILTHTLTNLYTETQKKWKLEKTPWEKWESYSSSINLPTNFYSANSACREITEHIQDTADMYVHKTSGKVNSKYFNPWWNDECANAIKARRKALKTFNKYSTPTNLINFKKARAKARLVINTSKRDSWRRFVTTINRFTPLTTVWKRIKKIDNKSYSNNKIVLKQNNQSITNPVEIVENLCQHFSTVSSTNNYTAEFIIYKNEQELEPIDFNIQNNQPINNPFDISEFEKILDPSKNSAPGEDQIPYEFYKRLPRSEKQKIVDFYNYLWTDHVFPDQWKNAHIIPIPKPGKPPNLPNSFRPISLTITLCKLMEKMIKNRLMNLLETTNTIVNHQFGFQKGRSTLDPLTQLEYAIREAQIEGDFLIAVFLDIEKAFDMVWAYGLLKELHNLGLRGNLPTFIQNFLNNRTIQVKINNFISSKYNLENGLPQGSILSVVLFLIAINKMFANCTETTNNLFCDDGAFWCRDNDINTAAVKIQNTLDKLTQWSKENGLKFSVQKSTYIIFSTRKPTNITLTLYDTNLPKSNQIKYLGMILDSKLNWTAHINKLKEKSHKRLSILRSVSKRKWGADRKTMCTLYKALIQSPIDYASFLYGTASDENLDTINKIQYEGIRIITGALRCTTRKSLEAEAFILPLDLRRHFLGLSYMGRSARLERSITLDIYAEHLNYQFWEHRATRRGIDIPWIGHAKNMLNELNLNLGEIDKLHQGYIYKPYEIHVNFTMHTTTKQNLTPIEANQQFNQMLTLYDRFIPVYTDGSVKDNQTSCAVVIKDRNYLYHLPDHTSIFTAELYAISMAIDKIKETNNNRFLICSDSLSALQTLKSGKENSLSHKIMQKIASTNKIIELEWVPSHMDIPGNEAADQMANEALSLENITEIPLSYNDFRSNIKRHLNTKWQEKWDNMNTPPERTTPLYPIKPVIKDWSSANRKSREEEIILTRLRQGSCLFTKKHLFNREPAPNCEYCQTDPPTPLSISHVMLECPKFNTERIPIIQELRKSDLPINLICLLNDEFPHEKLFNYLDKIQYTTKI